MIFPETSPNEGKFPPVGLSSEIIGGVNQDYMGGLCNEISTQPPGRVLEVELWDDIKAYGKYRLVKYKELDQLEGLVPSTRIRKRLTGKG